jgi:hypothetical protein
MAEGHFASETHVLSHSMEQMCVQTPLGKKAKSFESDSSVRLSLPQTADMKHKRERSESLMLSQTNDMLATKRRLRSRSRLGLGPEEVPSAFMSPPCSSKPRERTYSRSQDQNELFSCKEECIKNPAFNVEASSVYMTPLSEPREPLQSKDMNRIESDNFSSFHEQGRLTAHPECDIDSSGDEDTVSSLEDNTRLKLDFDQCVSDGTPGADQVLNTPDPSKIIGRRLGEKRIDIIKELADMNCEEICKQIFCNLEPRDLQR